MKKYDFPSYEMHKMAHDMFLVDIGITIKQWKEFGDINKMVNFIRKSPEWIVLHINTVDAPTSAYIAQKMALEAEQTNRKLPYLQYLRLVWYWLGWVQIDGGCVL